MWLPLHSTIKVVLYLILHVAVSTFNNKSSSVLILHVAATTFNNKSSSILILNVAATTFNNKGDGVLTEVLEIPFYFSRGTPTVPRLANDLLVPGCFIPFPERQLQIQLAT